MGVCGAEQSLAHTHSPNLVCNRDNLAMDYRPIGSVSLQGCINPALLEPVILPTGFLHFFRLSGYRGSSPTAVQA